MGRMDTELAGMAMQYVIQRDGQICANAENSLFPNKNCTGADPERLLLDHIDNDSANNDPQNWQALCRSCNTRKNPRGGGRRGIRVRELLSAALRNGHHRKHSCVSECGDKKVGMDAEKSVESAEFERNRMAEPKYRSWILTEVMRKGALKLEDAIDGGAELAGVSQTTVQRYLRKLCSVKGPVTIVKEGDVRFVAMKEAYMPVPEKENPDAGTIVLLETKAQAQL